jgi:rhamnosyl/mannosyltransferase
MKIKMYSMFHPFRSGIAAYTGDLLLALENLNLSVERVNSRFWVHHRPDICGSIPGRMGRLLQRLYMKAAYRLYAKPSDTRDAIHHYQVSGNPETIYLLKDFHQVKRPRVVTVHDQHFPVKTFGALKDEVERIKVIASSDMVLVHTQELKRRLEIYNSNIHVINHGVYSDKFAIDPDQAKRQLGLQGPLVSQIGFLFGHKGIQDLIKIAPHVHGTILIVGSGPMERALKELADIWCPGRVIFRPYATDEELPLYIAASDVIVFPRFHSQGECSGVMVQAMAAGKALVAYDLGCFSEYLCNGRGILVEPENPGVMIEAINRLVDDPSLRRKHEEACCSFSRENFEWSLVATGHERLYRQLSMV